MRARPLHLINTAEIELWPAQFLRARSNHDARVLSQSHTVLRRKRDGRFLAAERDGRFVALLPHWKREPGIDAALVALRVDATQRNPSAKPPRTLPLARLGERLQALGLDASSYGERTGLQLVAEPARLAFAGFDRYRRPLWLHRDAAQAWPHMRDAAMRDGVALDAISGYRSHDYQLGIFERKLARGLGVDEILAVNAAPGYSEHHSGLALDIGTPGEPPAEESFESTAAFDWLQRNAAGYGFHMSYPRGNPHGIVYEPWHWRYGRCGA